MRLNITTNKMTVVDVSLTGPVIIMCIIDTAGTRIKCFPVQAQDAGCGGTSYHYCIPTASYNILLDMRQLHSCLIKSSPRRTVTASNFIKTGGLEMFIILWSITAANKCGNSWENIWISVSVLILFIINLNWFVKILNYWIQSYFE